MQKVKFPNRLPLDFAFSVEIKGSKKGCFQIVYLEIAKKSKKKLKVQI